MFEIVIKVFCFIDALVMTLKFINHHFEVLPDVSVKKYQNMAKQPTNKPQVSLNICDNYL